MPTIISLRLQVQQVFAIGSLAALLVRSTNDAGRRLVLNLMHMRKCLLWRVCLGAAEVLKLELKCVIVSIVILNKHRRRIEHPFRAA